MASQHGSESVRKARPCPECREPAVREHAPFCSARCRRIDLSRWLKGTYVIPGEPVDAADGGGLAPDADPDED